MKKKKTLLHIWSKNKKWRESALRGTGDTLRALSDTHIHTYTHTQRFGLGKWRETALHGTIQKFPFSKVGIWIWIWIGFGISSRTHPPSSWCAPRVIQTWDMTHPYVTHPYVRHDSFVSVTSPVYVCDTGPRVMEIRHDSFIRVMWPGDMCVMKYAIWDVTQI